MKAYLFIEFRLRVYYCLVNIILLFIIFFIYSEELLYLILKPNLNNFLPHFIFTQLNEVFWAFYKLSLFSSIYYSIPFILIQVILYILPGLFKYEQKFICQFSFYFIIFNIFILNLFWSYIFPIFCNFFLQFEQKESNTFINFFFESKLEEYLNFLFIIYWYIFLISFVLYIFFVWSLNLKLNKLYNLFQNRKYIYLVLLLFIATFIAYDITSMLFVFVFICFLFEFLLILTIYSKTCRLYLNYYEKKNF